jgi:hypothetical protein
VDLRSFTEPIEALDLDAPGAGAVVPVVIAGSRWGDLAAVPFVEPPGATPVPPAPGQPDPRRVVHAFVAGVSADAPGAPGQPPTPGRPYLLKLRIEVPEAGGAGGAVLISMLATTQGGPAPAPGTPAPPSLGVGALWAQAPDTAPEPPLVLASLPGGGPAAGGPRLVAVRATFPQDPAALPRYVLGAGGAPLAVASPGMTSDADGNVYVLAANASCDATPGAPPAAGVLVVGGAFTACAPLPAPPVAGDYADVAVGSLGDPLFVTHPAAGAILVTPLPPLTPDAPAPPPGPGPGTAPGGGAGPGALRSGLGR